MGIDLQGLLKGELDLILRDRRQLMERFKQWSDISE